MKPPHTTNVLDRHGGFTAYVPSGRGSYRVKLGDTLWRPGALLKKSTTGTLVDFNEKSFYQNNNDVTIAQYKVSGYRYPVVLWFDNKTGERIA